MRSFSDICENFDNVACRLEDVEEFLNSLDQDEVEKVDKLRIRLLRIQDGTIHHELYNLMEVVEEFTDKAHEDIDKILNEYFDEIPHDLK